MQSLPTGTVTFLFSDIQGSTRLLQNLGKAFPSLLDQHSRLLRDSFTANNGLVVSTEGDSFFVVFPSAVDAVSAALSAQGSLKDFSWDEGIVVQVRMGLHSGEGILGGDNYVGLDVHRAARIMAIAYGGQILISDSTRALVQGDLPESANLTDLGEHRLKDLARPERLFQLTARGLPFEFPAIRSLGSRPNNLPAQLTSFVGREKELALLKALLKDARCLSLTGPGGTGKTRLSLELAREAGGEFENGTFFVQLATVNDPDELASTIAETLHLPETRGETRGAQERLIEHLSGRQMLLVLDNFEQLVAAGPQVSDLLKASDGLKVVVTTRVPLHIQGESEYPVLPLVLPDPDNLPDAELVSQYESVALFIERAVSVKPDFKVTNQNAPAIAEICARLDGLPLAIELAAARIRVLTPEALLARLGERLKLLVGGATDIPRRQQTLRGAIEWSYDLLEEPERRLFRRLAVFAGGWRLEEAESVCGPGRGAGGVATPPRTDPRAPEGANPPSQIDVFDGISSLIDKSLVKTDESESSDVRFFMLETIREYAGEKLAESDETKEIYSRHAAAYTQLADQAAPQVFGRHRRIWLDRLERDYDNLRAAHDWAVNNQEADLALRLVVALWRFWHMRGYLQEGRRRVEESLALPGANQQTPLRARALQAAGGVTHWQAEIESQAAFYDEALALWRQLGDERGIADALYDRFFPEYMREQMENGRPFAEESLALAEKIGDRMAAANAKWALAIDEGFRLEDHIRARTLLTEALETFRQEDDAFMQTWTLHVLGNLALSEGKTKDAEAHFHEAMGLASEAMDVSGILFQLDNLSLAAKSRGNLEREARLSAVASGLKSSSGMDLVDASRKITGVESVGRDVLTATRLEQIWAEAERWRLEEAIAYAMETS